MPLEKLETCRIRERDRDRNGNEHHSGNCPDTENEQVAQRPNRITDDWQNEEGDRGRSRQPVDDSNYHRSKRLIKPRATEEAIEFCRRDILFRVPVRRRLMAVRMTVDVIAVPMNVMMAAQMA